MNKPVKILCIAEAFGFGPASKLMILLRHMPELPVELTFMGTGCAYELCRKGRFNRWVQADPTEVSLGSPLHEELLRHHVLITAMEFSPLKKARSMGLRTIVLDSLFWMWPEPPCRPEDVDLYLCQNFIGVKERCRQGVHRRPMILPPLTHSDTRRQGLRQAVVLNFGGMDNPFASADSLGLYARSMFDVVQDSCVRLGLPLEVYGRQWILDGLKSRFKHVVRSSGSLPLDEFMERLGGARCLITSPGLEVLYEAFTLGVPVYLLPPQNNSQDYQAQCLQQHIPVLPGLQYDQLTGDELVPRGLPPDQAIQRVLASCDRLSHNDQALLRLREEIGRFLDADEHFLDSLSSAQKGLIEQLRLSSDLPEIGQLAALLETHLT